MNKFNNRRHYTLILIVSIVVFIFIIRLLWIQVIDDKYKMSSDNISKRNKTIYPTRGLVYDRNHKLIVSSEPCYDLVYIPNQVKNIDTNRLCQLLEFSKDEFQKIKKKRGYSPMKPVVLVKNISQDKFLKMQEIMFMYPGFSYVPRTRRFFNRNIACHLVGYTSEVDDRIIKKDSYYATGDYVGLSGIEKTYENYLRGEKGEEIMLLDVHNVEKGRFQGGKFDKPSVVGKNLTLTIDADLQEYAEKLMKNKRGCVVALEPKTGEVLTLLSAPSFNPADLIGRNRSEAFNELRNDKFNALFDRAVMARYPPGSTFKLVNGLILLQENVITPETYFTCHHGYMYIGCHHNQTMALVDAVRLSCNAYFAAAFQKLIDRKGYSTQENYTTWKKYMDAFGFSTHLGIDIDNELSGFIPNSSYFDKYYGKNGWKGSTILSMSIGQGEVSLTTLQLANLSAILANRGFYYIPHVVKSVEGSNSISPKYVEKHAVNINQKHFEPIIEGMSEVVRAGTGNSAFLTDIQICGKTGTAQNPHGKDHSIFICFAPKDNPKIAIAVFVENAGFGATWAAPIASLMIEKYLTDTIRNPSREKRVLEANLLGK